MASASRGSLMPRFPPDFEHPVEYPDDPPPPIDEGRAQAVLGIICALAVVAIIAIVVLQG